MGSELQRRAPGGKHHACGHHRWAVAWCATCTFDRCGLCGWQRGVAEEGVPVSFRSILFDGAESTVAPVDQEPAYFADLNLSQVAESITASREEYDLKPFLYTRLTTPEAITYRHEVLRDLEGDELAAHIASFAQKMSQMREHLTRAERTHYQSEQQAWFLHAVRIYCDAVGQLAGDLADASVRSHGLQAFRDYLADFINEEFTTLRDDARRVSEGLSAARYCLHIKGNRVTLSRYDGQGDYSAEIAETFSKFKPMVVGTSR